MISKNNYDNSILLNQRLNSNWSKSDLSVAKNKLSSSSPSPLSSLQSLISKPPPFSPKSKCPTSQPTIQVENHSNNKKVPPPVPPRNYYTPPSTTSNELINQTNSTNNSVITPSLPKNNSDPNISYTSDVKPVTNRFNSLNNLIASNNNNNNNDNNIKFSPPKNKSDIQSQTINNEKSVSNSNSNSNNIPPLSINTTFKPPPPKNHLINNNQISPNIIKPPPRNYLNNNEIKINGLEKQSLNNNNNNNNNSVLKSPPQICQIINNNNDQTPQSININNKITLQSFNSNDIKLPPPVVLKSPPQKNQLNINNQIQSPLINNNHPNYNINPRLKKYKNIKNDQIMDNLIIFFKLCYNKSIEGGKSRIDSFKNSTDLLKSKLNYTYKLYLKMNGIETRNNEVCEIFGLALKKTSDEIYNNHMPCSFSFDGYECINRYSYHPYHESSREILEKQDISSSSFKFSKKVPITKCDGKHSAPFTYEDVDLLSYFKKKLKCENENENENTIVGLTFCGDICLGCLLYPPTIRYTCGHIICIQCSESNNLKCPIQTCKSVDVYYKKEIDFNPDIGAKILCLDGGGIRGIVECCALQIIQDSLFGIEICSLFDLIVGTSTGGLIAILCACTDKTLTSIIESFTELAKDVFKTSALRLPLIPKYSRENVHKCFLKALVSSTPFNLSYSKTRVAVTAVTQDDGKLTEVLFSNYHRKEMKAKHTFITDCNSIDAAESTSAAPTYFPAFNFNGHDYFDGGIINNNPSLVALNEYKTLWPDKNIDILLSIGTGSFKTKVKNGNSNNLFNLASLIINLVTEVEETWRMVKLNEKINEENSFRVNQQFDNEIALDAKDESTIKKLKESFLHERDILNKAINKLLSSLFYLSNLEYWVPKSNESNLKTILKGYIKFKIDKLPLLLANQLEKNEYDPMFVLKEKNSDTTFKMINQEVKIDGICIISFEIENPPDTIDIICRLVSKNNIVNNTSISGCPFNISSNFNKSNK